MLETMHRDTNANFYLMHTFLNWCIASLTFMPILNLIYVTLDHKTSHKGQFFEIKI